MKTPLMLAALTLTTTAFAAQILEFDDVTIFGGNLSYGGADGVDPLVGTDIVFDLVTGVGTPITGPLQVLGGRLNFTTGPNITEGVAAYNFAGGGQFTLTGTVIRPDLSVVATGVLLDGSFIGESVVLGLGGGNGLFSGIGDDRKNPDLLAYYGVFENIFEFANTEIGFAAAGLDANGGFVADVRNADLINTAIPEPSTYAAVVALGALGLWRMASFSLNKHKTHKTHRHERRTKNTEGNTDRH